MEYNSKDYKEFMQYLKIWLLYKIEDANSISEISNACKN